MLKTVQLGTCTCSPLIMVMPSHNVGSVCCLYMVKCFFNRWDMVAVSLAGVHFSN